jgi:hypothetical protein
VTVHVTAVVPIGNVVPLTGAQDAVVGGVPPVTVGAPYDMATGCPEGDSREIGAGQKTFGESNVWVGRVGVFVHP